jgi:hypothetical protein
MRRIRSHLTYANVISSLCLFLLLSGGTAVALNGANTVFSDDIVNGEVKSPDLAKLTFTAVKPNPQQATDPCESGEVGIFCAFVGSAGYRGWKNLGQGYDGTAYANVAYARDGLGMVHLQGSMLNPGPPHSPSFVLPPGYRPAATREFAVAYGMKTDPFVRNETEPESLSKVKVLATGEVVFESFQPGAGDIEFHGISLDGIEFKAK